MQVEMIGKTKKIKAEDGKVLKCKLDGKIYGESLILGNIYYLNEEKLNSSILLTEDMFIEINKNEEKHNFKHKTKQEIEDEIKKKKEDMRKNDKIQRNARERR